MDSGTLIVAAVFIAICIVPFLITGRKYKKHKKQLVNALNQLAEQNNSSISLRETKGNFGIAKDEKESRIFFARLTGQTLVTRDVDLSVYNRCKMNNVVRIADGGEKVTERIELVFSPARTDITQVVLELYNVEYDNLTLSGELQVAEKWEQLIGNVLNRSGKINSPTSRKKKKVA